MQQKDTIKIESYNLVFGCDLQTQLVVNNVFEKLSLAPPMIKEGEVQSAIEFLSKNPSPSFLIIDFSNIENFQKAIDDIYEVCEETVKVIVIGNINDVELFRNLIDYGAYDYLVKPLTNDTLLKSLTKSLHFEVVKKHQGKLVAVMGTRGGAGTTTVAVNSAWILSHKFHSHIVYIDLNKHFGDAGLMLNFPLGNILQEMIEAETNIKAVKPPLPSYNERFFFLNTEEERLSLYPSVPSKDIKKLFDTLRSKFSYVFIDLPHAFDPTTELVLKEANIVILVVLPSVSSIRDTKRLKSFLAEKEGISELLVVLNRIGEYQKGELTLKEVEKALGHAPEVLIPFDQAHGLLAANEGKLIAMLSKNIYGALYLLCEKILGRIEASSSRSIWSVILTKIRKAMS